MSEFTHWVTTSTSHPLNVREISQISLAYWALRTHTHTLLHLCTTMEEGHKKKNCKEGMLPMDFRSISIKLNTVALTHPPPMTESFSSRLHLLSTILYSEWLIASADFKSSQVQHSRRQGVCIVQVFWAYRLNSWHKFIRFRVDGRKSVFTFFFEWTKEGLWLCDLEVTVMKFQGKTCSLCIT